MSWNRLIMKATGVFSAAALLLLGINGDRLQANALPAAVYEEGFENGYGGWESMFDNSSLTRFTGAVIEGAQSLSMQGTGGWSDLARTNGVSLKASTAYTLTFRYKVLRSNNQGRYILYVKTPANADNIMAGWQDGGVQEGSEGALNSFSAVAQEDYYDVTMQFTTANHSDYLFQFIMQNKDAQVSVDSFKLYEGFVSAAYPAPQLQGELTAVKTENFENPQRGVCPFWQVCDDVAGMTTTDTTKVINGQRSALIQAAGDWNETLYTQFHWMTLDADTDYVMSARVKLMSPMPTGAFFQWMVKDENGGAHQYAQYSANRILSGGSHKGDKASAIDLGNGEYQLMLRFRSFGTDPKYGYSSTFISLGIKGGATFTFDDFALYKDGNGTVPSALPKHVVREEFEDGFGKMEPMFDNAVLTSFDGAVIEGRQSIMGSGAGGWTDLFRSTNQLSLKPNTAYTLGFRYRVLQSDNQGRFLLYVKTPSNTDNIMAGWQDGGVQEGQEGALQSFSASAKDGYYEATMKFTTGNHADYLLQFCMQNKNAQVVFDSINLSEGFTVAAFNPVTPSSVLAPVKVEGFENPIAGECPFWQVVDNPGGMTTTEQGKVISGSKSAYINVSGDWNETLYTNYNWFTLEPNTEYIATARVKILRAPTSGGFLMWMVKDEAGGAAQYAQFSGRQVLPSGTIHGDKASVIDLGDGEYQLMMAFRSFDIHAGKDITSTFMSMGIKGGAEFTFDDFAVYKAANGMVPSALTDDEMKSLLVNRFEEGLGSFIATQHASTERTSSVGELINGKFSVKFTTPEGKPFADALYTNPQKLPAGSRITVSYRFKPLTTYAGSQLIVFAQNADATDDSAMQFIGANGAELRTVGTVASGVSAIQTDGYYDAWFSFDAKTASGYYLKIAIEGGGSYSLDDYRVIRGKGTLPVDEPAKPSFSVSFATVDFENGFTQGVNAYYNASLTTNAAEVISGSRSVKLQFSGEQYFTNWGVVSDSRRFSLEEGKTYRVQFKARVIQDQSPEHVYVALKIQSPVTPENRLDEMLYSGVYHNGLAVNGFQKGMSEVLTSKDANGILSMSSTFTVPAGMPMAYFMIGIPDGGAVILDDIIVTLIDSKELPVERSGILPGQGDDGNGLNSYTISDKLLYPFGKGQTDKKAYDTAVEYIVTEQ